MAILLYIPAIGTKVRVTEIGPEDARHGDDSEYVGTVVQVIAHKDNPDWLILALRLPNGAVAMFFQAKVEPLQ